MNRFFSSCRSVPTSPEGRYRLATVTPGRSASTYRPTPRTRRRRSRPAPRRARCRDRIATPLRPFAAGSAHASCHPPRARDRASARVCSSLARVSCSTTTSAVVASIHSSDALAGGGADSVHIHGGDDVWHGEDPIRRHRRSARDARAAGSIGPRPRKPADPRRPAPRRPRPERCSRVRRRYQHRRATRRRRWRR